MGNWQSCLEDSKTDSFQGFTRLSQEWVTKWQQKITRKDQNKPKAVDAQRQDKADERDITS
jgi:hypothetical protein